MVFMLGGTQHNINEVLLCRCEMTNRCVKEPVDVINAFQIFHPDMFRQVVAVFRGSQMPYKLLEQCLCCGRIQIMIRPVRPVVMECIHGYIP
jgi:hypothetical protein